ncbi:MAG: metallophosphoesterase, partial [Bryobacteraceae bacterium]
YAVGPVRFIALDTDEGTTESALLFRLPIDRAFSQRQLDWIEKQLAASTEPWKIVYGHHPIFSSGMHGMEARPRQLAARLLPILKRYKVDLYIAGHDHHMQHIEHDGIQFFISGGGGRELRDPNSRVPAGVRALNERKAKRFGFLTVEAGPRALTAEMFTLGDDGKAVVLSRKELSK